MGRRAGETDISDEDVRGDREAADADRVRELAEPVHVRAGCRSEPARRRRVAQQLASARHLVDWPVPPRSAVHPETRIIHVHNFLTHEECDHIIGLVKNSLFRSSVVDVGHSGAKIDDIRTVRPRRQVHYHGPRQRAAAGSSCAPWPRRHRHCAAAPPRS